MQPESNNSILGPSAPKLTANFQVQTRPEADGSGAQFAEEFERAQKASGKTVAEARHAESKRANEAKEQRAGRKDTAESARTKAESGREQASAARSERSGKSDRLHDELTAEDAQVGHQGVGDQQVRREPIGEQHIFQRQTRGEGEMAATDAKASSSKSQQESGGPTNPSQQNFAAAIGANAAGGKTAGHGQTGTAAPAPTPSVTAVVGPSTGSQAGAGSEGQLGQRETASLGLNANATASAEAPEAPDIMERLIVEREQRMEREASILRQFKAQLSPGSREISMQLSPAALGRVNMTLALREGRFTATVRTETKEAFEALEKQLPELQMALEGQGFEVVNFDLEMASDFSATLATGRGDSSQALRAPSGASSLFTAELPGATSARAMQHKTQNNSAAQRGGVDTWV
jgi:flagellar hook-length control protein FliK